MIRKPWGSEVILFESGQARVKLLRVKPGKRLSKQYHKEKYEAMMIISGAAILDIGKFARYDMEPGYIYTIKREEIHRLQGCGSQESVILEMAHGSDQDIVRLADDFGRLTPEQQPTTGGHQQ